MFIYVIPDKQPPPKKNKKKIKQKTFKNQQQKLKQRFRERNVIN